MTTLPDPVTVELVRAAFNAAAERMRITMIKTAYSHIISESLDFGCAIFDQDVHMVAQGVGLPAFQAHLGFPVEATVAERGKESMQPGDIFIHNVPYAGNGNHVNDVTMFSPVFWEGTLAGFVAVKAHWSDIGGGVPSSMQVDSTDVRQEGLLLNAIKYYSRGVRNEEVERFIEGNIRVESGTLKDVQGCVAVCRAGEAYFQEVIEKYGFETVRAAVAMYMDQSERRTRAALQQIPSGVYHAVGHFDNDGIKLDKPVRVELTMTVGDGRMTVDFTGTSPQVAGPFNCGGAIAISACRLLLKCLTTPDDPGDEGCFRPLEVILPPASVVNAKAPSPTARYYTPVNLLFELGLRALADAIPERIPAGSYADQMPTILFGTNPDTGKLFIQGDLNAGGTGARPHADGEGGLIIFIGSTARNNPVEVVESRNPYIKCLSYGLRVDSGGPGKYRGGLGIERVYRFEAPAFGTFTLERSVTLPWGLNGGEEGKQNGLEITDASGKTRSIRKATRHPLAAGDVMRVMTGGGGGYGPAHERPAEAVRHDLDEGYVSAEGARRYPQARRTQPA
jgi:N-methylhydantoinase B